MNLETLLCSQLTRLTDILLTVLKKLDVTDDPPEYHL